MHCAQYFVDSSLSPVYSFVGVLSQSLMCLRVLGIMGFTQSRWDVFLGVIGVPYVVMVLVVLFPLFIPGMVGFFRISMGFYKWVFDSLEVLNGFLKQVVVSRRDIGIRQWTRWLREDLSSRTYAWLRPDFVPPSPFLIVKDP